MELVCFVIFTFFFLFFLSWVSSRSVVSVGVFSYIRLSTGKALLGMRRTSELWDFLSRALCGGVRGEGRCPQTFEYLKINYYIFTFQQLSIK